MDALRDRGILDVIRSLSDQAASGRLQISTGMTDGVLFFDKGKLVDAHVGRLNGFQAINALASVPDASYNFDPAIHPPAQTSITAKERVLLKDFFGIEAVETEPPRDVDVSEVDPSWTDADDEATLVQTNPAVEEPRFQHVSDIPTPPQPVEPLRRSTFRPALFVILFLTALAAFALVYQLRKPDSTASMVPPVENPSPAEAPQSTAVPDTAAVTDLTGNWNVVNTVEQTSYGAYRNMQIGFNVSINQTGNDFTGQGEKISENGRSLPAEGRTPIVVKGTIDGDKVEATFSETGATRKTNGRFVWRIDKTNGGLTGTFVSNAARSSGKSAAKKEL